MGLAQLREQDDGQADDAAEQAHSEGGGPGRQLDAVVRSSGRPEATEQADAGDAWIDDAARDLAAWAVREPPSAQVELEAQLEGMLRDQRTLRVIRPTAPEPAGEPSAAQHPATREPDAPAPPAAPPAAPTPSLGRRIVDAVRRGVRRSSAPRVTTERVAEGMLSLDELQRFLVEGGEKARALAEKLEGMVQHYETSYAEGPLGFHLDRRCLRFERALLPQLAGGLEIGALDGIVVVAFPTEAEVATMASKWAAWVQEKEGREISVTEAEAEIRKMPLTTFLARHFQARGGTLFEPRKRIELWAKARFPSDGRPLHAHLAEHGGDIGATYAALGDQLTLGSAFGRTTLAVTHLAQDLDPSVPILQDPPAGAARVKQGAASEETECSHANLWQARARFRTPLELLAHALASNPADLSSYPDYRKNYEKIDGLLSDGGAPGADALVDGLGLLASDPSVAGERVRARSSLACTTGPGDLDLDSGLESTSTDARRDAERGREAIASSLTLGTLQAQLVARGLDAKLDAGSFATEIGRALRAYESGDLSFTPDLTSVAASLSDAQLEKLAAGLDSGALTGVVLTAYPTEVQVRAMASRTGEDPEALLGLPVVEYLARHFESRGGKVRMRENRLAEVQELRWPTDGVPLHAHLAAHGGDLAATHASLPPQPCLRDVAGTAALTFAYTRRDIPSTTPLLQGVVSGETKRIERQGKWLWLTRVQFPQLMEARATLLTPAEWFALLAMHADPGDVRTYPTPYGIDGAHHWEWLGGVAPGFVPVASSRSDGAGLDVLGRAFSTGRGRARAALRCTPGF